MMLSERRTNVDGKPFTDPGYRNNAKRNGQYRKKSRRPISDPVIQTEKIIKDKTNTNIGFHQMHGSQKHSTFPVDERMKNCVLSYVFDDRFSKLKNKVVKNWILVKENSNPFSWWKTFRERISWQNSVSEFKDLDNKTRNIERRDLAELLLIKALQKSVCRTVNDILFLEKTFFGSIENSLKQKEENPQIESDDEMRNDSFTNYKREWEKCLNRQDVIKIKDHLLQESFITLEDNEELVNDVNYYKRNKENLLCQIVHKVEACKGKGSFQCFIKHAENIIRQKQSGQKLLQRIKSQPNNSIQPAKKSLLIIKQKESFAGNDTHKEKKSLSKTRQKEIAGNDTSKDKNYKLLMEIEQENEKVNVLHSSVEDNIDAAKMIFIKQLGAELDSIKHGSVVIHFHPLDRDMHCKFDGNFGKLIQMLLEEFKLESKLPSGKYTLTAKVTVTQDVNKTNFDSDFKPLTDKINFVAAERSFLEEEIDIDAILKGFEMQHKTIGTIDPSHCRKDNARDLLNAIIDNNLEDGFISILHEYKMTYALNRYETYMKVYNSDTASLRRKIINHFSSIIQTIDIDDIREVLLDLGTTKESTLNKLVDKFENRRDVAMATLIMEFLKSGNAIHAFVYALFLLDYNSLLDEISHEDSQKISDADYENENCAYPVDQSTMYTGCFNITIRDEDPALKDHTNTSELGICALNISDVYSPVMYGERQPTGNKERMNKDSKRRYFIVGSVYLDVISPLFQQKLKEIYESLHFGCLKDFLNGEEVIHTLFHLRHINNLCCKDKINCIKRSALDLSHRQWKIMYDENPGPGIHHCFCKYTAKSIKPEDLDLSLCGLILNNCCNLTQRDRDAIYILRKPNHDFLRHNKTGCITKKAYDSLMDQLKKNVLLLDQTKGDELLRIQNRPFDDALCKKNMRTFQDYNEELEKIDKLMTQIPDNMILNIQLNAKKNVSLQNAKFRKDKLKKQGTKEQQMKPFKVGQFNFTLYRLIDLGSVDGDGSSGVPTTDVVMMDDGRLVMCFPYQHRIVVCNIDGSRKDVIQIREQGKPWRVTIVNTSTVAVSLVCCECIDMYDINNKLKLKSIYVPGMWWTGITTLKNNLVVGDVNRLHIIDQQTGNIKQTIKTDCNPRFLVHGSGDRIFYCDKHNLHWYSYTADIHHKLTLPSPPRSMTTLQDGSLCVVCDDRSLQNVSSDGKQYNTITTDRLECLSVSYNSRQRKLVILGYRDRKIIIKVYF